MVHSASAAAAGALINFGSRAGHYARGVAMDIGIGLDATLNLSFADQAALSQEAARLGYTSIWTPESTGQDAFQLCSQRWAASCQVIPEGLTTGIGVSPVLYRTPIAFAMSGGTMRSEEHTSELQSLAYLVCRLLLEKKKKIKL